mgnify:CR=1 FL=1
MIYYILLILLLDVFIFTINTFTVGFEYNLLVSYLQIFILIVIVAVLKIKTKFFIIIYQIIGLENKGLESYLLLLSINRIIINTSELLLLRITMFLYFFKIMD